MNPIAFGLALMTLATLKILPRFFPKSTNAINCSYIPSLIVYFAGLKNITLVGSIPHSLATPHLPNFSQISNWNDLFMSAFAVFALASLETLLSSSAVDSMGKGDMHNPNQGVNWARSCQSWRCYFWWFTCHWCNCTFFRQYCGWSKDSSFCCFSFHCRTGSNLFISGLIEKYQ